MPREEVKPIPPDPGEMELEQDIQRREVEAAELEMETKPESGPEPESEPELDSEPEPEPALEREPAPALVERTAKRKAAKTGTKKVIKPFPAAFTRFFNDEHQSVKGAPAEFFKYWRRICADPEFKQRVVVYIYRAWPAMMDGKRQVTKVYDEAMTPEEILRQFGCGDYVLRLNDTGSNGLNITNCSIRNLGARQLNEFPPVLNIQDLDFEDKSNQSYLLWARSRGMLTPEQEQKIRSAVPEQKNEKGEDMANAEAVKQLASTVDRITDKVIAVAHKERDESRGGGLPEKLLDLVTAASASATQSAAAIMQESVKQVLELQKQNANPLQNLKEVAGTLKDLLPKPGQENESLTQLMDREKHFINMIFQIQNERIKGLENLIEKMTATQISQQHAPAGEAGQAIAKPKSLMESIREMAEMKEELRELLGLDDGKQQEPSWMKYAPILVQGFSLLGTYIANAMHNLAVAKTGQGKPEPPPSQEEIQRQAMQQMQATAQSAGPTQQQTQEPTTMDRFRIFFQMIERPLLLSFNTGESGADFAAKLIELTENGMFGSQTTGRQVYDSVLEYGKDVVDSMIKLYPPIWNVVSQTPQKWEKFLTEFFSADEIWAQEEVEQGAATAHDPAAGRRHRKSA